MIRSNMRRSPQARHVAPRGIAANASTIVTWHLRDFPALRVPLPPDFGPLAPPEPNYICQNDGHSILQCLPRAAKAETNEHSVARGRGSNRHIEVPAIW